MSQALQNQTKSDHEITKMEMKELKLTHKEAFSKLEAQIMELTLFMRKTQEKKHK